MIKFVYQNSPLGTGDAVLKTQKFIKDKYFLMLLPDDLIIKKNCSKDMISVHKKNKASVMASMLVKKGIMYQDGVFINYQKKLIKIISKFQMLLKNHPLEKHHLIKQ